MTLRRRNHFKTAERGRWPWLSLLPFGLGSWAPILAGTRCGVRCWTALGVLWSTVALAGWVIAAAEPTRGVFELIALLLLIVAWIGGIVSSFAIRSSYERRVTHRRDHAIRRDGRSRWVWLSLLPLALGSWAPIVAGVRCGVRRWTALGVLWTALALAGWLMPKSNVAAALIVLAWMGGVLTSFAIRPAYNRRVGGHPLEDPAWPEPTERSRQWSVRYALAAYVTTFGAANAWGAVLYFGLDVHSGVGPSVLIVDAVLLSSLLPLKRKRGLTRQDLGLRASPSVRSLGYVALAFIGYLLIIGLWVAAVHPHNSAKTLANVHENAISIVVAVLAVAASAPIVEEIFFRGLLYRSLRNRLPIVPAALIAGALFGLVHITSYPLVTLPVKAGFGVIACLLYERTGSLIPGIALHVFVDASAIDVALTGSDLIVSASFAVLAATLIARAQSGRLIRNGQQPQPGPVSQGPEQHPESPAPAQ